MSAGKSIPHDSAHLHVTGSAEYVDDIGSSVDQLHVAIGGASIAAGRITAMDLSAVREAQGVVDVMQR